MYKKLKICSQIESYLKKPIELLESIEDIESANDLKSIQAKNRNIIFDYLREQNLPRIKFQYSKSFSTTYSITNEKKHT